MIRYGTVPLPFFRWIKMSPSRFVPLAFPSSVEMYLREDLRQYKRLGRLRATYLRSSRSSLQLYRVISDVSAGGMTMMGVRDGRFEASALDTCILSFVGVIGFGVEGLAADWKQRTSQWSGEFETHSPETCSVPRLPSLSSA